MSSALLDTKGDDSADGRIATKGDDGNASKSIETVCVIGAGVAGLQTAVQLLRKGFDVTVLEKSDNVGGVWRENYADFGLQVPRELYEFPDFPYPDVVDEFPTGEQVQAYIEAYMKSKKGLKECVRFRTCVTRLFRDDDGGEEGEWTVEIRHAKTGTSSRLRADFVVVCTGMYTAPPHIPSAPGQLSTFVGDVLHSSAFVAKRAESQKGRDVVVVGGGKSAIDCAVAAAKAGARTTTIVFREAHWPVPRRLLFLVPFKWGTYSRFGHSTLRAHHDASSGLLHTLCSPLKWVWWRTVELMFRAQFGLSGDLLPSSRIDVDLFGGGQILTYEFHRLVSEGTIRAVRGTVKRFEARDVVVVVDDDKSECRVAADAVVYGTGFTKSYDYLSPKVRADLDLQRDGLWLYRNIVPPRISRLAFVGSEVTTFNNILTHALQAKWLAAWLAQDMTLPSAIDMEDAVAKERDWKRSWMPAKSTRAATYQLHMMHLHDTYVKDMGLSPWRKGWNVLAELFAPYAAADYAGLFA